MTGRGRRSREKEKRVNRAGINSLVSATDPPSPLPTPHFLPAIMLHSVRARDRWGIESLHG